MKINTEMILALETCENRKENYLKFYKDFNGSLEDFFKLEKISFRDKIWVSVRLVDKNIRVKFAIKCAEHVLPIFEKVFKNDKRIRNCIEFLKSIDDFNNLNNEQLELLRVHKNSAFNAYRDAADAADAANAYDSANEADSAAAADAADFYASYAASYASYAATVAATTSASAVIAATSSATSSATSAAKSNHNTLQIHSTIFQFLLDLTN